jgi:hypothetical protein
MSALGKALDRLGATVYVPPLENKALKREQSEAADAGCGPATLDLMNDLQEDTGTLVSVIERAETVTYRLYSKKSSFFLECSCSSDIREDKKAKFCGEKSIIKLAWPALKDTLELGIRAFAELVDNFPEQPELVALASRPPEVKTHAFITGFGIPHGSKAPTGLFEIRLITGPEGERQAIEAAAEIDIDEKQYRRNFRQSYPGDIHGVIHLNYAEGGPPDDCGLARLVKSPAN